MWIVKSAELIIFQLKAVIIIAPIYGWEVELVFDPDKVLTISDKVVISSYG